MSLFKRSPLVLAILALSSYGQAADNTVVLPTITVIGGESALPELAGSGSILSQKTLESSHPFTVNEALRKVAGVHARDEEGFGLRPNIAIRGLNPTRSTKITLLEDGLPLAYAPYGDNASYYHPMVDRYQRIEVLKGASSLLFGPQTIGGVINYITPIPSKEPKGYVQATAGNHDFANVKLNASGHNALVDYSHKEGDGARDNLHHELDDLNVKYSMALGDNQALTLRGNFYQEQSQQTYTGLTQKEFELLGSAYNPFKNDSFEAERVGVSATHDLIINDDINVITSVYYSQFDRDWWRQASNSTDSQCGAAFTNLRLAGQMVNPDNCNSTQGRLRSYTTWGVEPRLTAKNPLGELQVGLRVHREEQDRKQINAKQPLGRTGTTAEDNLRTTDALSAFIAHRFDIQQLQITPIIRYEDIDVERTNRLSNVSGSSSIDNVSAGLGVTYNPTKTLTVFASVHEGFAPPRVEDLIGGAGTVTEVDGEESLNMELGVRSQIGSQLSLQAAYFRNDYDNLIAVGSIAGGSTPLSQGEALFSGVELSADGQWDNVFSRFAYTWLNEAEQSTAYKNVASKAVVGVAGKRQPYAPEHTLTAAVGYEWQGLRAEVEAQYVGEQFSDFANTEQPSADGQKGRIASYTVWNSSVNYAFNRQVSSFVTVKNLSDKTYIVDRTRGIQVGMPRLVQVGVKYAF